MTYTVHPITLFALMREGQEAPVAIYHTEHEAQAVAEMLAEFASRKAGKPYEFADWASA
jgi:hypothetical protein